MLEFFLELVVSILGMLFELLVKIPGFLVDLVLKPGNEARANKWLLACLGIVFYSLIIGPILVAVLFF
ncbi:MAG: hypothetical protein HQ518_12370 [Rhodopirellula sp.]|nr:hypothetical protein [Rhodopirellula sp.]